MPRLCWTPTPAAPPAWCRGSTSDSASASGPPRRWDDRILTELPEVRSVQRSGSQVLVTGTGDLLQAVVSVLARNHIVAADLRMEQANLDDAFMALTTHEERS